MCSKIREVYDKAAHQHHLYFSFFVEAMSLFFVVEDVGLKGIAMPLDGTNVMDVEFVDDTSLYLDGQLTNLQKMHATMQTFWTASSTSNN